MPVELTAVEAEMIRQFTSIVDDSVERHTREMRDTMKRLEPLVQKHEIVLGENETSGVRGQVVRNQKRLHDLEHFRTEWRARVGTISAIIAVIVSVVVWLMEHFLKTS